MKECLMTLADLWLINNSYMQMYEESSERELDDSSPSPNYIKPGWMDKNRDEVDGKMEGL